MDDFGFDGISGSLMELIDKKKVSTQEIVLAIMEATLKMQNQITAQQMKLIDKKEKRDERK